MNFIDLAFNSIIHAMVYRTSVRMSDHLAQDFARRTQLLMTKNGTLLTLRTLTIMSWFISLQSYSFYFALTVPALTLGVQSILQKRLWARVTEHLDQMIYDLHVYLKCGHSLREAIVALAQEFPPELRMYLTQILNSVVFLQQKLNIEGDSNFHALLQLLQHADQHPHQAQETFQRYLFEKKTRVDFRRKSGSATRIAKTQVIILSILFIMSLVWVIRNFGWESNILLILTSLALFVVGCCVLILLTRPPRWNI